MASHKESIGFCPNIGHGGKFSPTNTFESFGPPVTTPQIPRNHAFQEAPLVVENPFLGGGFKYSWSFHPKPWGRFPFWRLKPPTSYRFLAFKCPIIAWLGFLTLRIWSWWKFLPHVLWEIGWALRKKRKPNSTEPGDLALGFLLLICSRGWHGSMGFEHCWYGCIQK